MKILCNLCLHFAWQDGQDRKKNGKKITQLKWPKYQKPKDENMGWTRVSVQGVKSFGGHFACLCRGFEFYGVKKKFVIIFQKENGNTFTLFIIFIVKSLQKEQNSTNLLLWPPICRNKSAITPKWFNSLDTNSNIWARLVHLSHQCNWTLNN